MDKWIEFWKNVDEKCDYSIVMKEYERVREETKTQVYSELENKLDELNGEKGNLCLYCGSKEYNGKVGIVHSDDCIILELRRKLNKNK